MLKQEFETLTGQNVSEEEFTKIHEMYIYSSFEKDEFCADWAKHHDSALLNDFWERFVHKRDVLAVYKKQERETAEMLIRFGWEYGIREATTQALALIGEREVIKFKIDNGIDLTSDDKDYIINHLS